MLDAHLADAGGRSGSDKRIETQRRLNIYLFYLSLVR